MQVIHHSRRAHAEIDDAGIGSLQLTDAGKLNIVGSAAIAELRVALARLAVQERLRVLVLRGSGEHAFIGGADIHEMAKLKRHSAKAFISNLASLCDAVAQLPVPVIARLSGWCLGGGLEVAMACDLRLADDSAKFGMPEVKVGIPSVIHASLLPRLVGQSRAQWMLLCGEHIDAAKAEGWGLVHERCAVGELDALVEQRARALADLPPQALRQQKRLLGVWQTVAPAKAIADSIDEFARAYDSGEPQRLMGEFVQRKRGAAP